MIAAPWPRADPTNNRLLVVRSSAIEHHHVRDLASLLDPGDLLVVNDAATLPASLPGDDRVHEWRLLAHPERGSWWAVAFGPGDWRTDTDVREPAPELRVGERVRIGGESAIVAETSAVSRRLYRLAPVVSEDAWFDAVYRHGSPVRYSYLGGAVALADVQTPWAGPPWAFEAPSAAFPLRFAILDALRARGVGIATVTEAAGLSATGDPRLDRALPLPERYRVPAATTAAILATRQAGRRVIAAGTSAARALESAARGPSEGTTTLRIGPNTKLRVVDGLISNVHGPGESHWELMHAFATPTLLQRAHLEAASAGYLVHEFGDGMLIFGGSASYFGRASSASQTAAPTRA